MARPARTNIAPGDAQLIVQALLEQIQSGAKQTTLDAEAKAKADNEFRTQVQNYHDEPHYWFTWHYMGEDDHIDVEHVGAAGVAYSIRKEERVLVPQAVINALKLAVVVGKDYEHPVKINDVTYYKKISRPRFNYTVEQPAVSPEEAQEWRMKQARIAAETADFIPTEGGDMSDLVR